MLCGSRISRNIKLSIGIAFISALYQVMAYDVRSIDVHGPVYVGVFCLLILFIADVIKNRLGGKGNV